MATRLSALPLLLGLVACDVDPTSAVDYDVAAHVELDAVKRSAWAGKAFLSGAKIDLNGADDCGPVLEQADAVTLGAGEDRVEMYIEGNVEEAVRDACLDSLKSAVKGKDKLRVAKLSDELFAVAIGPAPLPTPTQSRMQDLLDADPSPKSNQPIWFTANQTKKNDSFKYAEGWADPRKGLQAHVQVEFKDAGTAGELHGKATLALTALRLSGELGDLGNAIKLGAAGDTITADVKATDKQMKAFAAKAKSDSNKPKRKPESKSGVDIQIEL